MVKVQIHRASMGEVNARCGGMVLAFACAEVHFYSDTCHVWVATDDQMALEHELEHCNGRDHVGSNSLRDAWERWKKVREAR